MSVIESGAEATHQVALSFEDGVTRFITCRPDQTVADASYRQRINIPLDCRDGACGTCKALCESGEYDGGDYIDDALSDDEAADGYALPCSMRPKSDLVLQIASTSEVAKTKAATYQGTITALDRLSPTTDYSGFRRCDLVIEAVFEDVEVKRKVLAECEAATREACVFASNTSSLPIAAIARDAQRKGRVLGMHFFSPVHKMPLLEVIVTKETEASATATAVGFGRRIGKHVIVVRDGPGFYTTRTLAPYLNEAARLVEEGAAIEVVDRAIKEFGFPVGPITLLDEVGIDVGAKVAKILHQHFGARLAAPEAMARIVDDGRQGRKNGRGFYDYSGKKRRVDASLYALVGSGQKRRAFDPREIQERLVYALLNETALCLQEGILRTPRDGDVGAIFGLGFPPFLGGPFRYLDHLGASFAVELLEGLAARHGARFQPAPLLAEMAKSGKGFHA